MSPFNEFQNTNTSRRLCLRRVLLPKSRGPVTSEVDTNLSLAIGLSAQSPQLDYNAIGQTRESCIVPELKRIPTHGCTYLS
jgi:hypothetical protein